MSDALQGLTVQQRGMLAEFYARELAGRGAQTSNDFAEFTTRPHAGRRYVLSEGAVRDTIVRLKNRGLLRVVFAGRPRTYGLTETGREIARLVEAPEGSIE